MTTPQPRAIGYMRLSTAGAGDCWTEPQNQRQELADEANRRGWTLQVLFDEGHSGKTPRRPALQEALRLLDEGEADVLLVGGLDRLTRSLSDLVEILERSAENGWSLSVLRPQLDTSDAAGNFTAHLLAASVRSDREFVSRATRTGMQRRREEGAQLGRPRTLPEEVVQRIIAEREAGASLRRIADGLTIEGVPTAQGGVRWYASTVRAVIEGFQQREADHG